MSAPVAPARRALLPTVLVAAALLYPLAFLLVALARLGHPFELEWMEGGTLDQVHRLVAGRPMYVAPSLDFISFDYTPLYYWTAALAARVLGAGFTPLRLVSLLAALGSLVILFVLARRETKSTAAGILAASLFAATYRLGGAWLDIGRPDSLYLLFVLGGFLAYRALAGARGAALAGVLFAAGFLAKQTALVIALPLALHALLADRRRFAAFAGTLAALVAGSTLVLDRATHGWYTYYIFGVALGHRPEAGLVARFWSDDLGAHLAIAALLAAWFLRSAGAGRGFHLALAAGLVGAAWWLRCFRGSYDNALLPGLAAVSLLASAGWHDLRRRLEPGAPASFLHLALFAQLALLVWNPLDQIPTRADREAGERLIAHIRTVPGPVLVPAHPWLAERAGKGGSFHEMALVDVTERRGHGALEDSLTTGLARALAAHRWAALVLDTRDWIADDAAPYYEPRLRAFSSDTVFWSRTGMLTRPETVLFPKP